MDFDAIELRRNAERREAERREAERVAQIYQEVANIEDEIAMYTGAREDVAWVEGSFEPGRESWSNAFQRLNGNSDAKEIEKKSQFEGEMAKSLRQSMSELVNNITNGVSNAASVAGDISYQIMLIDNKISELDTSRYNLLCQI
ncbi:hypothetical protein M2454_002443 [Aequitasia blattaphilus]|uniref:Uncharacterized protein n=1 Tax=Aequitasia blattaphilus TaxID=2949332 RepID=A0ABT1EB68_9FIRM|nr:hypothetical protein [Aequitasia blattaphilus]MCP1103078.1 hypothetical protein [Aequitasia blattaphilus]MCR8615718.1 hypothetical protein [Aequitasia blattaphilus]